MNPNHWLRQLFPTARRLLLERSLRLLKLPPVESVLIVGAGHDPYRDMFSGVKEYVRVDIIPTKGSTDVVADALFLPLKEARFDCVFASECMEHLPDPFLFVQELIRVLKSSGTVILTVPFMYHQHGGPQDYWRWTRKSLERLFLPFAEVEVASQGNRIHVISDLVTTSFSPWPILFPLRVVNHLLVRLPGNMRRGGKASTAPSGFLLVARK